ncbi:hypothetical protein HWV07_10030 [Natronomonas salina]|uniref:DUF5810 domain-containing protein n=1 Tax=Natronomonas salina TaxID=1710540 RepID=UPI0015B41D90|nr:DUF5810 domain-containing protein [Natronomonas salina]QLD89348.1 hypothetical protein HWV07_10030 [Natronomonas salina]
MGYACPVCEDPQADAGHLANHLAFTAILGDDDHEAWLEEHAPGWGEMGEAELAEAVVDHVEETEFPQVFEDTVGGLEESTPDSLEERSGMLFEDEGFGDDQPHDHQHGHGPARAGDLSAEMDPETEAIVEEAREMTREMLREAEADEGDADGGEEDAEGDEDDQDENA